MTIRDDFHIETADWGNDRDRTALCALRKEVFVREQNVPPEMELNEDDPRSVHLLARGADGTPIGTGRLSPAGKIARMTVLRDLRGRGIGSALLQRLLEQARARGMREVHLHAQVDATDFYLTHGFEVNGADFMEAGIPHRPMRLALAATDAPVRSAPVSRPATRTLAAQNRGELTQALCALLTDTRHTLCLYSRDLDAGVLDDPACLAELRRIAVSGRGADIRILVQETSRAQRDGHRLLDLAQRLPSVVRVRRPTEDTDLEYPSAFIATDAGGYLFRAQAWRADAEGSTCAPGRAAHLAAYFDAVWERSETCGELRALEL